MSESSLSEPIWEAEGREKRAVVRTMFGRIARTYDLFNGIMSLTLHRRWRRLAARSLNLRVGDSAIDVCTGTGEFLGPLRRAVGPQGQIVGVDFSAPMLAHSKAKDARTLRVLGDACRLPVADAQFEGYSVGWGIRNVEDIDAAHREAFRVLRPGGRFVSLDMARPRNPVVRWVSEQIFNTLVPLLGRLCGDPQAYTYLPQSTQRFWDRQRLKASMESAGFIDVTYRDLFFGNVCLHAGLKPGEPAS